MSLDYATLDLLRQNHPAWRLLRSDHAPLVASFLHRVFIAPNVHNLKNLNLQLPLHELIVITGVSGSGKSSLAFDTIYAEGQRRYGERRPGAPWRFSVDLHCPDCDIHYPEPRPGWFSFNSPAGACETCRGFDRTMGIDYGLVIPDPGKSLAGGAVKPWQTPSYQECQDDLLRFAHRRGVPVTEPWGELSEDQ